MILRYQPYLLLNLRKRYLPGTTQTGTGLIRHGRSRRDDGGSETMGPNRQEKGGGGDPKNARNQTSTRGKGLKTNERTGESRDKGLKTNANPKTSE
jgi:hypothetical protein